MEKYVDYYASAIVNADPSGLEEDEEIAMDEWEKYVDYYAPAHWASAIVNADPSGLEEDEEIAMDEWLDHCASSGLEFIGVLEIEDGTDFIKYHDAYAFFPYASDCLVYRFENKCLQSI